MSILKDKNCLIAYFSRNGLNYVSGDIIDIPIGNTEIVAKIIEKEINADLLKIDTINPYPKDYYETTKIAQNELRIKVRPELISNIKDISKYDVIFLGYPNWWGTMPMAVYTFLESHDFSGKTIIPFCTHEGSGMGNSESDIKKALPNSIIKKGLSLYGSNVN